MSGRLILLTGVNEARFLLPHLSQFGGGEPVHVDTIIGLEAVLRARVGAARLLSFCTAAIVPRDLLDALGTPSYNIHPGPPNYPGRHPESWGAYDGASRFGATLHEMAPRVDVGAIIDVEMADMADGDGQAEFGFQGYRAALQLFVRWVPHLIADPAPLPHSVLQWSGRKTTRAQLLAMCRMTPEIDRHEFDRRRRAFAQQPGSKLRLDFRGTEFVYQVPDESRTQVLPSEPVDDAMCWITPETDQAEFDRRRIFAERSKRPLTLDFCGIAFVYDTSRSNATL